MDMDQAAVFLAGSILTALGFIVVIGSIIVVNNLLNKYWKPVRIFTSDSWNLNPPQRFATLEDMEKIAPHLDETNGKEATKKV
jgi:HKD family nuclease